MNRQKFILNYQLLRNFTTILGLAVEELKDKVGIKQSSWYYYYDIKDIPLSKLIDICNAYHVPISYFIIPSDSTVVINTKDEYIHKKGWKDITYDFTLANTDLTIKERKTVRDICTLMGCSSKTYCKIFPKNNISRVMTNQVLRLMNNTDLYIGDYIKDRNRPIEMLSGMKQREDLDYEYLLSAQQTSKYYEQMIKNYQSRLKRYNSRLKELQKENASLKQELALYKLENISSIAAEPKE